MKKIKLALRVLGMVLLLAGLIWFIAPPLFWGDLQIGSIFGCSVCLVGILFLAFYPRAARAGGWKKAVARLIAVFYVLGISWCGYLTLRMCLATFDVPPADNNVIILGSQIYTADRPSESLRMRLEKACEYLDANPLSKVIVTGGQGNDEPCAEALTEKNVLVSMGISEDRIYMEDKSKNTRENLRFALALARKENLGSSFVVVTQGFHMFRALNIADEEGIEAFSLVADTNLRYLPNYYGRELLSLTKWHLELLIPGMADGD